MRMQVQGGKKRDKTQSGGGCKSKRRERVSPYDRGEDT